MLTLCAGSRRRALYGCPAAHRRAGPAGRAARPAPPRMAGSVQSFERVYPLLPPEWRVVAVDQRGHGESDKPEKGYAIDDLAADVPALLDALGLPRAVVVGHSMGSFVARRAAERAPRPGVGPGPHRHRAPWRRNAVLLDLEACRGRPHGPGGLEPSSASFRRAPSRGPVPADFMSRVIENSAAGARRASGRQCSTGCWRIEPGPPPTCPTLVRGRHAGWIVLGRGAGGGGRRDPGLTAGAGGRRRPLSAVGKSGEVRGLLADFVRALQRITTK